jgi:hypothetical protein
MVLRVLVPALIRRLRTMSSKLQRRAERKKHNQFDQDIIHERKRYDKARSRQATTESRGKLLLTFITYSAFNSL